MKSLDDYLRDVIEREGSDLHLADGLPPKARIHGALEPMQDDEIQIASLVEPILAERHNKAFEEFGETDLAYEVEGAGRFRVNVFRHKGGLGAVFRTIPQRIPTIEELEIPVEVKRFTEIRKGLVLITGPTGSGKSSTLAALVDIVNRERAAHIITVEDPIEFVHQNKMSTLTQREVGRDTDSFAEALRSATRQSPDLILVGEMRDRATINLALTLAEMGMLVFSTLHTNSAGRSVDRIIKVFPEDQQPQIRTMLAASIQGILSQILCRRADRAGRVPATELLFTSHAVQNVIREGATHKIESMLQAGRAQGMHRMDDSLYRLVEEGVINREEAYRKAEEKARFETFMD